MFLRNRNENKFQRCFLTIFRVRRHCLLSTLSLFISLYSQPFSCSICINAIQYFLFYFMYILFQFSYFSFIGKSNLSFNLLYFLLSLTSLSHLSQGFLFLCRFFSIFSSYDDSLFHTVVDSNSSSQLQCNKIVHAN